MAWRPGRVCSAGRTRTVPNVVRDVCAGVHTLTDFAPSKKITEKTHDCPMLYICISMDRATNYDVASGSVARADNCCITCSLERRIVLQKNRTTAFSAGAARGAGCSPSRCCSPPGCPFCTLLEFSSDPGGPHLHQDEGRGGCAREGAPGLLLRHACEPDHRGPRGQFLLRMRAAFSYVIRLSIQPPCDNLGGVGS